MSTETPENTNISSAEQFRKRREEKEKGENLKLSSGLVVRVRRPEVQKLIANGHIPANLVQVFLNVQGKQADKMKPEDLSNILQFQAIVAKNALLSPKVVDEPNYENNEISIEDIDEKDLEDLWSYVNGGLEAVKSFRDERDRVLSGLDSDTLPEQTT